MHVMPYKELFSGRFCGGARVANTIILSQRGRPTVACRRGAGSGSVSAASPSVQWRLQRRRFGPGCLPPQVGANDHALQDSQPALQLLPLFGGVRRRRSLGRRRDARPFPSAGPCHAASPGAFRRDCSPASPPLPPDLWFPLTSLRARRIERYPREGISSMKSAWKLFHSGIPSWK